MGSNHYFMIFLKIGLFRTFVFAYFFTFERHFEVGEHQNRTQYEKKIRPGAFPEIFWPAGVLTGARRRSKLGCAAPLLSPLSDPGVSWVGGAPPGGWGPKASGLQVGSTRPLGPFNTKKICDALASTKGQSRTINGVKHGHKFQKAINCQGNTYR